MNMDEEYLQLLADMKSDEAAALLRKQAQARGYTIGPVYHGTTHDWTVFDPDRATPENDMGQGLYFTSSLEDAVRNYRGMGPDLTNKVERLAEHYISLGDPPAKARAKAKREAVGKVEKVLTCYLKMRNPFIIGGGRGETRLNMVLDDEGNESGDLVPFLRELQWQASHYGVAWERIVECLNEHELSDIRAELLIRSLKNCPELDYAEGDEGVYMRNEIVRRAIEAAGFDGIIDHTAAVRFPGLKMAKGTVHYIVFNANQAKLTDVGTVDDRGRLIPLSQRFDEKSPDLRNPMKPVASIKAKANASANGRRNALSHRGFYDRTNRPKAGGRQAGNPAARHNPVEDRDEKYYWLRIDELRRQALELRSRLPLTPEGSVDVKRATPEQLAAAIDLDRQLLDVERELKLIASPPSGISYSQPAPKFSVVREGPEWARQLHRELASSRQNPMTRALRQKLATILEDDDRVLDYDRASGEELYRLYDVVVTDQPLNEESLTEIEGLLDDNGMLVILSGEMPSGLGDHFKRAVRHRGMLLVQHPKNPEEARIKAEQARREA